MKKITLSTLFKICPGVAFLLLLGVGCYNEVGQELFYRLDCYKFKVVDVNNNPVPNAELRFTFKSNFDLSGKNGRYCQKELRTDENGKVVRFGWIRNTPYLGRVRAKGFYAFYSNHPLKERNTTITLFPRRNPVALWAGTLNFKLEENYQGKIYFRFADLELSIPVSPDCRLAYRWDEKKKSALWVRKQNADFRPDMIFDFQHGRLVGAEALSAIIPEVPDHRSEFSGVYEAPSTGYANIKLPFDRNDPYCRKGVVFTFPYQGKNCYGLIRRIDSPLDWVTVDYQFNLTGSRNLERDEAASAQPQDEAEKLLLQQKNNLWCNSRRLKIPLNPQ